MITPAARKLAAREQRQQNARQSMAALGYDRVSGADGRMVYKKRKKGEAMSEQVEYIDAETLARKLGVGLKSIRKWTYQHRIPGMVRISRRCVRYSLLEIDRRLATGSLLLPARGRG